MLECRRPIESLDITPTPPAVAGPTQSKLASEGLVWPTRAVLAARAETQGCRGVRRALRPRAPIHRDPTTRGHCRDRRRHHEGLAENEPRWREPNQVLHIAGEKIPRCRSPAPCPETHIGIRDSWRTGSSSANSATRSHNLTVPSNAIPAPSVVSGTGQGYSERARGGQGSFWGSMKRFARPAARRREGRLRPSTA